MSAASLATLKPDVSAFQMPIDNPMSARLGRGIICSHSKHLSVREYGDVIFPPELSAMLVRCEEHGLVQTMSTPTRATFLTLDIGNTFYLQSNGMKVNSVLCLLGKLGLTKKRRAGSKSVVCLEMCIELDTYYN